MPELANSPLGNGLYVNTELVVVQCIYIEGGGEVKPITETESFVTRRFFSSIDLISILIPFPGDREVQALLRDEARGGVDHGGGQRPLLLQGHRLPQAQGHVAHQRTHCHQCKLGETQVKYFIL